MGVEAVAAAMEHGGSDAVHDRLRLNMEVPVELVRVPPADEAGAIAVDPRAMRARAPPARVEWADTSKGRMPRSGESTTTARTEAVIAAGRRSVQAAMGDECMALMGVVSVAPARRK